MGLAACYTFMNSNTLSLAFYPGEPPNCGGSTAITQGFDGPVLASITAAGTLSVSGSVATISATGFAPSINSFMLQVSPNQPTVALSGDTTFSVQIIPKNGFQGTVLLTLSGLPNGVICISTCNRLASPTQPTRFAIIASDMASTGTFPLTLTANSLGQSITQPLSLTIVAATGVKNIVDLTSFNVESNGVIACPGLMATCFSIQQNFFIDSPSPTDQSFWAQNVIIVGTDSQGNTYAWGTYEVYPATWSNSKFKTGAVTGCGAPCLATLPFVSLKRIDLPMTFTMTSTISGSTLTLTSSFESSRFSNPYPLPNSNSFISNLSTSNYEPQLDIVSAYTLFTSSTVFFSNFPQQVTRGQVTSFIQISGMRWTPLLLQNIFGASGTSTAEQSSGLAWLISGSNTAVFVSIAGDSDQGIGYAPEN